LKNKIAVILYSSFIMLFLVLGVLTEGSGYSVSERRKLAEKPELSYENITSGNYMTEFEEYSTDNFPLRESFRRIKALFSKYILCKKDNNGIYVADGHISSIDYPLNMEMVSNAYNKFNYIYDSYLKGKTQNIYLSVIPDKNCYLASENGFPHIDYNKLTDELKKNMSYANYIDIFPMLDINDYYKTDSHWKQENITHIAEFIGNAMGKSTASQYEVNNATKDFAGVFLGQAALPFKKDELNYLTNDIIDSAVVTYYDTGAPKQGEMYNMEKAYGKDPYEIFLSGTSPLIEIENKKAPEGSRLVLFRDSYGSSLAPLLVPGYRNITVVDIRYIQSNMLGNFIDFEGSDVLFLYSTSIINNSMSLR